MVKNILTSAAIHGARNASQLLLRFKAHVLKQRNHGIDIEPHDITAPVKARVDHGRWILDCGCGSGVGAHPEWPKSYCFGCGAIYSCVVFPAERALVEQLLAKRPVEGRYWYPGETLEQLVAENRAHGVGE